MGGGGRTGLLNNSVQADANIFHCIRQPLLEVEAEFSREHAVQLQKFVQMEFGFRLICQGGQAVGHTGNGGTNQQNTVAFIVPGIGQGSDGFPLPQAGHAGASKFQYDPFFSHRGGARSLIPETLPELTAGCTADFRVRRPNARFRHNSGRFRAKKRRLGRRRIEEGSYRVV